MYELSAGQSRAHPVTLPAVSADRVAVAVGLHPVEVWPDWYEVMEGFDQAA